MKAFFKAIVDSGVKDDLSSEVKRSIVLSNYLAIILAASNVLIFFLIPYNINLSGFREMLTAIAIFIFPILLNRLYLTHGSHLYLCWVPPIAVNLYMILGMQEAQEVHVTIYDGLRFYLLATSCIPYLLLSKNTPMLFIAGTIPSLVLLVFCDTILDYAGVGASQKGTALGGYSYTPIRAFIAYVIINGSCFSLRSIIDKNDILNQRLSKEIEEKNILIQNKSEEKIQQSEFKYRSLFEQASDAIIVTNLNGKLTDCNIKLSELVGYSKDELLKFNIYDLIDKSQLEAKPLPFERLGKGDYIYSERRFVHKNKSLINIEASIQKLNHDEILAIVRDVSTRRKMEEDLREAEAKFRTIVEKSLVGVYIMLNGKFDYVNPRFAEIFGYEQHELNSTFPAEMVVHFDDRATMKENVRARLAGEMESVRYELKCLRKNGDIIWVEAFGSSLQYKGTQSIIGTLVEITERKKFEEQQDLFASVVNSSEDAIITQTLDGIITSWNGGAEDIFGYSSREMVGKNVVLIIPPARLKEEDAIMELILRGERVEHFETQRLQRNGTLIYTSLTVSPIRNEKGMLVGVSKIARDITLRKKAEEEIADANYSLNERVKELTTLYRTSQLLQPTQMPLHEVLQRVVSILPAGWQYPDITAARIVLEGMEFNTDNFTSGKCTQLATFITQQGMHGSIEVCYLNECAPAAEGPFLMEERNLINMIAEMLQAFLSRRYEAEALKRSEANQTSIINNTNFLIWSVNRAYEFISFNIPMEKFMDQHFGISIKRGNRMASDAPQLADLNERWIARYTRALRGEAFKMISTLNDITIEYALNPIIEEEQIIGVAVFGEDITDRVQREDAIQKANKQIGELRLMALRSVMNPHFIFNSLNSIQYYIMENDQINAVTYLSTFSKLIRAILNNSVHAHVQLAEELEMLSHYIKLEAMRFDNKFNFVIDVSPSVDTESIEIPSMLIQPYVENAILHGLYNKPDTGLLTISIKEIDSFLLVEIEDDGVGRLTAASFKTTNVPKHKSMGTALTEERLKLINKETATAVEIIDLEQDGKAVGTKVKIKVKI